MTEALIAQGIKAKESENYNEAYTLFSKALLPDPDNAKALTNMAAFVANRDLVKTQLALMQRAYELKPDQYEVQINLGSAYTRAGEYGKALRIFNLAAKQNPTREAWHHVGMAYHDCGLFDKAVKAYDKSLAIGYDDYTALNRALSLIASEDLIAGFEAFESRWALIPKRPIWNSDIPKWGGEDLTGKTLIVHHEQGWGDTLQACRFLPRLKAMAGKVLFASGENLHRLIETNFGIDCIGNDGPFKADYHVPMMSVPRLGIDWPDIDGKPYLKVPPRELPRRGSLNVGLVWGGSAKWVGDSARSIDLLELTPLFAIPNIGWYSLQQNGSEEIQKSGLMGLIADAASFLTDWYESARIVAGLDAVVTVDTSTAHVSAALGVPTYVMLPKSCCWRWPRYGRRTPWYDAMRLMRQEASFDWTPVVQNIKDEMIAMKTRTETRAA